MDNLLDKKDRAIVKACRDIWFDNDWADAATDYLHGVDYGYWWELIAKMSQLISILDYEGEGE